MIEEGEPSGTVPRGQSSPNSCLRLRPAHSSSRRGRRGCAIRLRIQIPGACGGTSSASPKRRKRGLRPAAVGEGLKTWMLSNYGIEISLFDRGLRYDLAYDGDVSRWSRTSRSMTTRIQLVVAGSTSRLTVTTDGSSLITSAFICDRHANSGQMNLPSKPTSNEFFDA